MYDLIWLGFTSFRAESVIFQLLMPKVNRKVLFFSPNFALVTWVIKILNLKIFQNIPTAREFSRTYSTFLYNLTFNIYRF